MFSYIFFWFLLQKLFEKMKKEGVMYKPATAAADVDNDAQDGQSYSNGPQEKKEFVYQKDSGSEGCSEPIDLTQPEREDAYMKTEAQDVSSVILCLILLLQFSLFS